MLPLIDQIELDKNEVQVVITAPSRELAEQIYQVAKQIVAFAPSEIRIAKFVGGTDKQKQLEQLQHQQPQLAIGTPGRMLDMANEGALLIHKSKAFVVDEADMTLDLGFLPEVDQIASKFSESIQMLVFSATVPEKLRPFLKKYLTRPIIEEIKPKTLLSETIENWLISTKGKDREQLIYQLLTLGEPYLAVVFANTKEYVDEITEFLQNQGLKVAKIHGGIASRERKRVMRQIQHLDYQYVVATDLAARGIDIEGISHVINAELPRDLDFFIHRVGRTGRNQLQGTAITLYDPSDERAIDELEKRGIVFEPKEIKNGEVIATYDRNRRKKTRETHGRIRPQDDWLC
ncbi:ATP-dependent RNA helicase [Tetragenococcus muriaticus PMC-11-5]|uniref:ATP-dependent RNA helicase n=1 Tax=Tetragenococcus muriaticus PMC-11-5 TaxID=1302649 RepID=A0A091C624_9ENTE|nr:ATP-dependent RNA helicase [Tetragenococcus muriaticus PMC-11-5]